MDDAMDEPTVALAKVGASADYAKDKEGYHGRETVEDS
jgi:hypothetical protein